MARADTLPTLVPYYNMSDCKGGLQMLTPGTLTAVRQALEGQPTGLAAACAHSDGPLETLAAPIDRREAADAELAGLSLNPRLAELDRKAALLRLVARYLNSSEDYRLSSIDEAWEELARDANSLNLVDLRSRVRRLFKEIAALKGRRHATQGDDFGRAAAPNPIAAGEQVPREKEGKMPITLQVKDVQTVPEGQHEAVVRRIEERESKFTDSRHDKYLAVIFELTDGAHAGRQLTKGFSPALSSKSNLGRLWKRLKRELPVGQTVDVEELIGEHVQIIVTHEQGDDGEVRERISEVFAPLAEAAREREPVQAGVPF